MAAGSSNTPATGVVRRSPRRRPRALAPGAHVARWGPLTRRRGDRGSGPSSLMGRECELEGVATEVKSHRLVAWRGVGGVGKTRLAIEVATRLVDEFPDGVWLFELAPVGDP